MSNKTNEPITLDALPPGSVVELQGNTPHTPASWLWLTRTGSRPSRPT